MPFNELLRSAVRITIDKREGLDPEKFDPYIEIQLADGSWWYISTTGEPTQITYSSGSAA